MTPRSFASSGLLDRGSLPALAIAVHGLLISGAVPPVPETERQPGGYVRPIIYLDEEGKRVDLAERRRQRELASVPAPEPALSLSPSIQAALNAMPPGVDPFELLAMLQEAEHRVGWSAFDREIAADQVAQDDEAVILAIATML